MQTDAGYRTRIRQLLDDTDTSHSVKPDLLTLQVDGTRTSFILSNNNVVTASLKVSVDGGVYGTTGLVVDDAAAGLFHLGTPPAADLQAIYFYQFFTDTQIDGIRDVGISKVGSEIDATARANVVSGLFTPACKFAAAEGCRILANKFARMYPTTAQGQSADQSVISKQYKELAVQLEDEALAERKAFWGQRHDSNTEAQSEVVEPDIPGGKYTPDR
jgi:hypothetical protein